MKDSTLDRLYELSSKVEDRLVTPLILEYYRLENSGLCLSEEKILKVIEIKYANPILN